MDPKTQENFVWLGEIRSDIKHLLNGQDKTSTQIGALRSEIKGDMQQFDDRLKKVESQQWKWAGMAGVFSVVTPIVVSVIIALMRNNNG